MSAFGRRNGTSSTGAGARPQFGVARPMKGGSDPSKSQGSAPLGGDQFPPLPGEDSAMAMPPMDGGGGAQKSDAMSRLADRVNGVQIGRAHV